MTWLKGHWQLFLITALLYALWNTDVAWPLRMLVVLFHELSHGLAAILTGGEVVALELSRYEGGVAWTRGGSYFWIASAGYLGSLLIGVALFVGAVRTRADKAILTGCGVLILLATALYIREGFTVVFCTATGGAMIAVSLALPARYADLLLRVIGLSSMLYVPWDIYVDTIKSCPNCTPSAYGSDAANIAGYSFGTEAMWGWIWLAIALAVIAVSLRFGLGSNSNIWPLDRTKMGADTLQNHKPEK